MWLHFCLSVCPRLPWWTEVWPAELWLRSTPCRRTQAAESAVTPLPDHSSSRWELHTTEKSLPLKMLFTPSDKDKSLTMFTSNYNKLYKACRAESYLSDIPLLSDLKLPMNLTYSYTCGSLGSMAPRSIWQQNSMWFLAGENKHNMSKRCCKHSVNGFIMCEWCC